MLSFDKPIVFFATTLSINTIRNEVAFLIPECGLEKQVNPESGK